MDPHAVQIPRRHRGAKTAGTKCRPYRLSHERYIDARRVVEVVAHFESRDRAGQCRRGLRPRSDRRRMARSHHREGLRACASWVASLARMPSDMEGRIKEWRERARQNWKAAGL